MLGKQGIVSGEEVEAICGGLDAIEAEIESGEFPFREELEDIHMNVETRLSELIGEAAGRLHTARSRNDQVALDVRLFVRDTIDEAISGLRRLQQALLSQAEANVMRSCPVTRIYRELSRCWLPTTCWRTSKWRRGTSSGSGTVGRG